MTISDLIAELERFDPDQEVRWAAQPSCAMEYDIGAAVESVPDEHDEQPIVCLVEGGQIGYLPGAVRRRRGRERCGALGVGR